MASEIYSIINQKFKDKEIHKIGNQFVPAPVSVKLEKLFYPSNQIIYNKCCKLLSIKSKKNLPEENENFLGPY